jgi:hypothetical protein
MSSKLIMDTQVPHMNIVKVHIPHGRIHEAIRDVRRWRIKHLPFRKVYGGLDMELYDSPKISLFKIKYAY